MSNGYYLDQVKKCVTFIFLEKDVQRIEPVGTGFFVSIKFTLYDAVYLVTAKRILQTRSGTFYNKILIRLNTKRGTVEYIELDLSKHVILTHPDGNVDLVATLLYPDSNYFDYLIIPQDYFTNTDILFQKDIRVGSTAFFAGLFANFYGKQRNYPVVRFGKISLMTNEMIDVSKEGGLGKSAHLYLVECQSLGGFSGCPVFFERDRITREKLFFSPEIYLGGIMKGHYNDIIEAPNGIVRELNASLALVTPCYLLYDLLHTESANKDRQEAAKDSKVERKNNNDS
jgi:hypothetical protein